MTAVNTPDRETLTRASHLFAEDKALHWDDAVAQAANLLEAERAEEAERQAKNREMSASLASMWSCPVCGANAMNTALCDDCLQHQADIRADRARAKPLPGGGDRRAAVEAWMDRVGR